MVKSGALDGPCGKNMEFFARLLPFTLDKKRSNSGVSYMEEMKMAEVRFNVDDDFLKNLQQTMGTTKTTDIMKEALTVFNWALKEKSEGRQILSADADANNLVRLATPGLDSVVVKK
jgi:hypothetical protein